MNQTERAMRFILIMKSVGAEFEVHIRKLAREALGVRRRNGHIVASPKLGLAGSALQIRTIEQGRREHADEAHKGQKEISESVDSLRNQLRLCSCTTHKEDTFGY